MNDSKITTRYAKALFNNAKDNQMLETVKQDIDSIYVILKEVEDFERFFISPIIKVSKKYEVIEHLFKNRIHQITYDFLRLITENRREAHLKMMCLNFNKYFYEHYKIIEATIKTVDKLSEPMRKDFIDMISKSFKAKVNLTEIVDPRIIGGYILTIDDNLYDASIATKLKNIKKELQSS